LRYELILPASSAAAIEAKLDPVIVVTGRSQTGNRRAAGVVLSVNPDASRSPLRR